MASKWITVQDIRLAAIWRLSVKRGLSRAQIAGLLADRAGLSAKAADQLSLHWWKSGWFRDQREDYTAA